MDLSVVLNVGKAIQVLSLPEGEAHRIGPFNFKKSRNNLLYTAYLSANSGNTLKALVKNQGLLAMNCYRF